jgi:hypothetical protein
MGYMPPPRTADPRSHGPQRPARPWYQDAVSAFAFFVLALVGGKGVARALGPIGGLFYLILTAGTGYLFARAAWRGLSEDRRDQ